METIPMAKTAMKIQIAADAGLLQQTKRECRRPMRRVELFQAIGIRARLQRSLARSRHSARALFLAYGFLRGRKLRQVENNPRSRPKWARVLWLVLRYTWDDPREVKQRFSEWIDEARLPPHVAPAFGTLEPSKLLPTARADLDDLLE